MVEEHKGRTQDSVIVEDEETESAMESAHVQREEELQVSLIESIMSVSVVEEHKGRTQDSVIVEDEETESAMASAHVQREEELQVSL